MSDELLYDKTGPVATLTLNRPDRMNAISTKMLAQFSESLLAADRDTDVRAIVITGAGRAFCAGLDIQDAAKGEGIGSQKSMSKATAKFDLRNSPPVVLHSIDTPTICALNGGAAGYGMDMALGCDIRIASEKGKLAAAFTKRGIVPESGGTWLLPRLVGWSKAAEIIFTGRTLSAEQCLEVGLVSKVVPAEQLMNEAMSLAEEISANAPLAVQASKKMMRMAQSEQFDDHVDHVLLQLMPLFKSKDFGEGLASFLEKRKPEFEGR